MIAPPTKTVSDTVSAPQIALPPALRLPGITSGGASGGKFRGPGLTLVDQRRRVYDPRFGRFVQTDPLGYPDGLNPYAAYHVMWGGVDPYALAWWNPASWFIDTSTQEDLFRRNAEKNRQLANDLERRGDYETAKRLRNMANDSARSARDIHQDVVDAADDAWAKDKWDRTNGTISGLTVGRADLSTFAYGGVDPTTGKAFVFDEKTRRENECFSACIADNLMSTLIPLGIEWSAWQHGTGYAEHGAAGWGSPSAPNVLEGLAEGIPAWDVPGMKHKLPRAARELYDSKLGPVDPPLMDRPGTPKRQTGRLSDVKRSRLGRATGALSVTLYLKAINACREKCFCDD